jgi:hypothetical protein
MQYLERAALIEGAAQGLKIAERDRIDTHGLLACRHLYETEFGPVSALAQKLGVNAYGTLTLQFS